MAFQNLKPGSKIYIFYKNNEATLEIGQVVGDIEITDKYPTPTPVTPPYPGFPNYNAPQPKEQIVNLTVKLEDGKTQPIKKLTPTGDIEDCGNGIFVSCSKDAINAEIMAYKQISDSALSEETLNIHRTISMNCAANLEKINPEIVERQIAEKEKQDLKNEVKELRTGFNDLKEMISDFLAQFGEPSKK